MKKILLLAAIALSLIIMFTGCSGSSNNDEYSKPYYHIIMFPDKETAKTVNGYKIINADGNTSDSASNEFVSDKYYCNTKSKKFHKSNCDYAQKMSEVNLRMETSREILISEGYSPCKVCNP